MKSMLGKHCLESEKDWDDAVTFVLFAACEYVQESPGFSLVELVFGHDVRDPMKLLKEQFLIPEEALGHTIPEYVQKLRDRLQIACALAKSSLFSSQTKMKHRYDQKAKTSLYQPGDKLLIISPISGSALSVRFAGA